MPEKQRAFGFLNVDKPLGMTSHDVVARVRRGLNIKKVGHAGTLDPLATGVLVICLGNATRLSEYAMATSKRYRARLRLGQVTTTYDAEGEVVEERDPGHVTRDEVEAILPRFRGAIEQLPPMHSAVKQGGRKLYELARAGEEVERKPRHVQINALDIVAWEPPEITLDVACSSGTYIRTLAYDIGEVLGVGAHLSALRRTASGSFSVEEAVTLDALLEVDDWTQYLLPPDTALQHLPALHLVADDAEHVMHGRNPREVPAPDSDDSLARAYNPDGKFIALMRASDQAWRPHKVFSGS